jgi:2-dehydro-3-deoxy-D-arabinonate dehydratase
MDSAATGLWRLRAGDGTRVARGPVQGGPTELLPADVTLSALLSGERDRLDAALDMPAAGVVQPGFEVLPPVDRQEVWAAGVTYVRSRDARKEESQAPDHYDRVYEADRPELFFKSSADRVRGPGDTVCIRADSTWDVPEPELGVVADGAGRVAAYVIGNDMSSRSIEGENPLYLPQAKTYQGSCALGPCIVPAGQAPEPADMEVALSVHRDGADAFGGTVSVGDMRRTPQELLAWLFRALDFPGGVVLLTGTGLVPDASFTLQAGDEVRITISGLGELRNPVAVVGADDA